MLLALDVLAVLASATAVHFDERSRRIPNWLSYGTALLGLTLRAAWALTQLDQTDAALATTTAGLLGALSLALLFGVLSVVGVLGFGDTKLLTGLGACLGYPWTLQLAICVLLSGGVVALAQAARQKSLRAVAQRLVHARALLHERVDEPAARTHKHLFGYAIAIAIGTLWVVVGRHFPWILPL